MIAIELTGLTKEFVSGVEAVGALSLTVDRGECLVLAGPSGCGKTTTLRLIAGLETPSAGAIALEGRAMAKVPPWRRPVAMAWQRPALFPNRTVYQNLTLGLKRRGWFSRPSAADLERVREMAALLELHEVLGRYPAQLSGGQQHRVGLGRALLRQAPILLLDEPLGHLDAPLRLDLRRQLILLRRRFPATMIHVTHDAGEALALGDRLAILARGQLLQCGAREELLTRPVHSFVMRFLRDASIVRGLLRPENGVWRFSAGDASWEIPRISWLGKPTPGEVELALTPDQVGLGQNGAAALAMELKFIECDAVGQRVVARNGSITLAARCEDSLAVKPGEKVMMRWHWTNTWIFDLQGRVLGQAMAAF